MPRASLKQRKDGRYVAKYQGRQFYGATQSEAYSKRDAFKRQVEAGLRAEAGSIPLSEYAAQWVHAYKSAVSDRTFNNCVRVLNSLVSIVGDKPLKEVYPIDIQNALALQAGKSKSHIDHYKRTVSAMFQSAVHNRLILVSPCVSVSAPRGSSGSHRAIRKWERDLILQSDHRFTPAVMVMLYAGLRRGEALALNVDRDVDFKSKTITVREAVRFDSNQPIVSTPKTDAGLRTVPLPSILATVLRPVRGLIAPAADGRHMSETAFVRSMESYTAHLEQLLNGDTRRWYGRRKGQGEDWLEAHPWQSVSIRTHDLRHSYCTMLFDAGVDVKTAQKWMGHKDIATTMRIYTHLSAERESRSVRNFHAFMASDPVYGIQPGIQPSPASSETRAS